MNLTRLFRIALQAIAGRTIAQKILMRLRLRYWPNIDNPATFNEFLARRMLKDVPILASTVADKFSVRDYVAAKIPDDILVPLLWNGTNPREIPWDSLPTAFVIKFTHNSGNTIVVDDKAVIDREAIEARCQKALADRYIGQYTNERWYLHVMPQVVIEKRLRDAIHDIPLDYKFFVFRGRVATIQVDYGRFTNHTRTFYSPSWQREPFGLKYPAGPDLERPARLDEMLGIAETLGKDFPFARIDLYLIDNRDIRFGEITLAPEAGLGRFTPDDMDVELGRLWKNSL